MNIATIKYNCASNGEGVRTVVYVSGCKLHCKGCFNKEAQDFEYGEKYNDKKLEEILKSLEPPYIQGLSILGGEPFDPKNQEGVFDIVTSVREKFGNSKDIWIWTGYTYDTIPHKAHTPIILKNINVLVDGPFMLDEQEMDLVFRGSKNQRILYLKDGKIDKVC